MHDPAAPSPSRAAADTEPQARAPVPAAGPPTPKTARHLTVAVARARRGTAQAAPATPDPAAAPSGARTALSSGAPDNARDRGRPGLRSDVGHLLPQPLPKGRRRGLIGTVDTPAAPDGSHLPEAGGLSSQELPVGWVVVVAGPARGTAITLHAGASDIGSGAAQEIPVDAAVPSITAMTYGTLHYAEDTGAFSLSPGRSSALLTLNGAPVTARVALVSGDCIGVGPTGLRFVALCDDGFAWRPDGSQNEGGT